MSDETLLILVLSEHRIFGWMLSAFEARMATYGDGLRVLGAATVESAKERGAPKEVIDMLTVLEGISDHALQRDFSKQKSQLAFFREVTQEVMERFIRPRIERSNLKAMRMATDCNIPVFIRKFQTMDTFFKNSQLRIVPSPATCRFNFVRDKSGGLRYFISLTSEGRDMSLMQKPGVILSDKPCIILTGNEMLMVADIEAKKLKPFFDKSHIIIPGGETVSVYLKNFVIKTMQHHDVRISGIEVTKIEPARQAFLTLERDFAQEMMLVLSFVYDDDTRIFPGNKKKKIIELVEEGEMPAIRWYERDTRWEKSLSDYLMDEGLTMKDECRFYAGPDDDGCLADWLNRKEDEGGGSLFREFIVEDHMERRLHLGEAAIVLDFDTDIDWFELKAEVVVGKYRLPFQSFVRHIMEKRSEYILPDGTVFLLPSKWFEKYYGLLRYSCEKDGRLRLGRKYASLLDRALDKDVPVIKRQSVAELLRTTLSRPPLPQLCVTLREYQKEGFYWLEHLHKHRFGGCLADDMGLGKTLQVISLLKHIYSAESGSSLPASLVVTPTSLLHNWSNEVTRFAPDLKVLVYAGEKRVKDEAFDGFNVVITSYGLLRNDIDHLQEHLFQVVILDESQFVKNPSSQAYRAAMRLSSLHRLTLTGTPLENSLEDLWTQFNFINEGLLGDMQSFKRDFLRPIAAEGGNEGSVGLLKTIISPFLLRRTKEEVTPELPPLIQETVFCDMTEMQADVYEKEKNRIRNEIIAAKEHPDGLASTNFATLAGLTRLRQLSNHPVLVDAEYEGDSGKMNQVLLSFETLKESRHKVLVFSSYVKYLNLIASRFDAEGWKYAILTGQTINREEEIRRFTESDDISCFFISLKAGSTGLNLTAADYVFILDPWWNPAAEIQAMSRAHRIGQEKSVIACRFISTGTIEEKIQLLQASKAALYETFISNNNPLPQFTMAEVEELLD
ncbi:MAG: DEAD/DEAH box helicase [Tannerellaceae bacterium]|nr:DEAD/DEAH box helicase [Tannerellaceae bacterium]